MIMLPWRASGVRSKMSLFITVATRQGNRPSGRSPNTSRSSTIGKDGKHGWGTYPRLSMSDSSMQGRSQHEKYFVSTIDIRGQRALGAGPTINVQKMKERGIAFVNTRIESTLPFNDKEFDFAYSHHVFRALTRSCYCL